MSLQEQYAKALWAAAKEHPREGAVQARNLRESLKRRGHEKLLPRIWSECRKLALKEERSVRYAQETPESRRIQILLELYERLIRS